MSKSVARISIQASQIFPDGFWKISGIVLTSLAVLVLVAGAFHASSEVPYPKDTRLEFPADQYATASERFTQPTGCILLDQAYFTRKAIALLGQELSSDPVRQLVTDTTNELRDKLVIVRRGRSAGGNFEILYEQQKSDLEREVNSLEKKIRDSSYMSSYGDRASLENVRRQLAGLESLRTFLSELYIKSDLGPLSYTDTRPDIQLICGHLTELPRNMTVRLRDPAPVVDANFLIKAGIPGDSIEGIDFAKELKTWEETVAQAKGKHSQSSLSIREQINRQVRQRRETIRNAFYTRWLGFLVMTFSTLCTFLALKRYSRIIMRKGLPRKSSFEIYFATNITSLVLRWVALIIVVVGMVELWGFLLLQFIQSTVQIPLLPLFNTIAGFVLSPLSGLMRLLVAGQFLTVVLYSVLAPVAFGLLTVVQSWLVLLLSEYICFISNAYHVLYNLAHPGAGHTGRTPQGE